MEDHSMEKAEAWHLGPSLLERQGGVWLVRAGRNEAMANYSAGPKQIDCFGLHIVKEGSIILEYEHKRVVLYRDDAFCLMPGIVYRYRAGDGQLPPRMTWLTFDGPQTAGLLSLAGLTPARPYRRRCADAHVRLLAGQILKTLDDGSGRSTYRTSLIYRLFAYMEDREGQRGKDEDEIDWLDRATEWMNLHYAESVTIAEIARVHGVHRSYFAAAFAGRHGVPPRHYLIRLRIGKASELLRSTDLSITEVALTAGYPDVYAFSRAFRKETGQSPGQYREG